MEKYSSELLCKMCIIPDPGHYWTSRASGAVERLIKMSAMIQKDPKAFTQKADGNGLKSG
jgi:hypothetical protein